jgi:hypothetical protein
MNHNESNIIWKVAGSVTAVVVLGWGLFQIIGLIAYEKVAFTREFGEDLTSLDVDVDDGSVTIVADRERGVQVVGSGNRGLFKQHHTEEVQGSSLVLRSNCNSPIAWCDLNYTIHVPASLAIDASSDNGRIRVRDVTANLVLSTSNGSIETTNVSGVLDLSSDNGSIRVIDSRSTEVRAETNNGSIRVGLLEVPTSVAMESDNGSITAVLPNNGVKYRTDTHSSNGSDKVSVNVDSSSPHVLKGRTSNGSITFKYAE